MAVDVEAVLHRDLAETKAHASGLSQQVEALKKELGNSRKQAGLVAGLEASKADLAEQLKGADVKIKLLERELASAVGALQAGQEKIAAAEAIADGIQKLRA